MQTRIENELRLTAMYKEKIAKDAIKYQNKKYDKKMQCSDRGRLIPEYVSHLAIEWAWKKRDTLETAWYYHSSIKDAAQDCRQVSRWETMFQEGILVQAQKVLKKKVPGFIPDLVELQEEIESLKRMDDEYESEDDYDYYYY